jgi:hypothetical protein
LGGTIEDEAAKRIMYEDPAGFAGVSYMIRGSAHFDAGFAAKSPMKAQRA